MAFTGGTQPVDLARRQPLVDAASLAHALLRAPRELWFKLDWAVQGNLAEALKAARRIPPYHNNWVLFPSMIETFLATRRKRPVVDRLLRGLQLHRTWYLGDGWWGDGPEHGHTYLNSLVVQPMMYDIFAAIRAQHPGQSMPEVFNNREDAAGLDELEGMVSGAVPRSAALLEALIHPDGSFPAFGRSIIYRTGAFHLLSLAALKHLLPGRVPPGQARIALTRVINRTLDPRVTYDERGWLRVGVVGSQPHLAHLYLSQGSLYQAAAVFLPLGLPAKDPFWADPDMPTTSEKVWGSS